jgi:hypothetical protein
MRTALTNLQTSLVRIRNGADYMIAQTAAALADPAMRAIFETQQCGSVVLLTGYFEGFLKDCVRAFIDQLSRSGVAFAALPPVIRDTHFESGGNVLTRASQAARKGRATSFGSASREDIAARLHSASTGPAGGYQIVWEAFADTEANPAPAVVTNVAQRLGLGNVWPTVAAKASVAVGAAVADGALTSKLADLVSKRNECAHTGTAAVIPTAVELKEYAETVDRIGQGFVGALEDLLATYAPPPPPPAPPPPGSAPRPP